MLKIVKQNELLILLLFYIIASIAILLFFDGTGENGSGDSILHFLYSNQAINNKALFFNHWAKPLFVLVSFPFAQFGIIGMKVFNVIVTFFSLYLTYSSAKNLGLKKPIIAPIILLFTPLFFVLTFSGLTEPLFALFLILSSFLFIKNNYALGTIILSFLPFVRSEGLIIIGVFAFYMMIKKLWKYLPLLSIGHLFYSIVGYFFYKDFLWVFNKIPYAKLTSTYGNGKLSHFVHQQFYVIGAPIYFLLGIGIIFIIYSFFKSKENITSKISLLILGTYLAFFIAHSLFWFLGIFNSMGLKRVLISVAPLIAIISLFGLNFIIDSIKNLAFKKYLQLFLMIAVILFPFSGNKAAIDFKKDFSLAESQKIAIQTVEFVNEIKNENSTFSFSDAYLSLLLDINYFDEKIRNPLTTESHKSIKASEIIIWDNWFSVVENGVSKDKLLANKNLKHLKTFSSYKEREITYMVFIKK